MKQLVGALAMGVSACLFSGLAAAQDDPISGPVAGPEEAAPPADSAEGSVSTSDLATDQKKIKLGLRLGYGLPMGNAVEELALNDLFSGMVPVWLDAGYMVTPNVMVGAYFQYGIASVSEGAEETEDCDAVDCSGSNIRFGVQGQYHFSPGQSIQPWAGIGVGYEIATASAEVGGEDVSLSVKGFEFLNLQGGADFKVADVFAIGPFASFSLAQYSTASMETPLGDESEDIENTALHQWLMIGAKGSFSL